MSRNASPTRATACPLHGCCAVSIGASPKYHSKVAHPRNAMVRSSMIRHHWVAPRVVTGTRAIAQIATPKPVAVTAAAGRGMLRTLAWLAWVSMSSASQP